jgi:CRP-like cAMP-binding protein
MESFAELIHNHAVFNGLTAEEIAELALISRKVNYAKGTCIFSESQPTTDFYVLAKGKVNLHFSKEHLISVYPGEVFGDWAMLNETVRLATATAIDEMEAFAIDATRFKNPQHLNASIALKVVMDMAKTLIGRVQAQSQVASRLLIRQGESETVEFKSTLRKNLHTQKNDSAIELAVLKTIAGFLNAKGGVLFIGVDDAGQIVGMEPDQFANTDKMLLHLGHLVSQKLGPTAV